MNIKWNEYTWYSKLGAVILFIGVIPMLAFYVGTQYEKTIEVLSAAHEISAAYPLPSAPAGATQIDAAGSTTPKQVYNAPTASSGTFKGKATIVATITPDCHTAAKPEDSGLKIYKGNNLIEEFNFNADGSFDASLAAGTYTVYGGDQSPGTETHPDMWAGILPQQIAIASGSTTILNLSASYVCNAL
jgi:hypothetical protein